MLKTSISILKRGRDFLKALPKTKVAIFVGLILSLVLFFYFDLDRWFQLEFFINRQEDLLSLYKNATIIFVLCFLAFYVFCATLSIPGAAVLTLIAGSLFNFVLASFVVSIGGLTGAFFCFLISRFLLREFVQKKFHKRLKVINKGLKKDGAFYLFSLRLVPILPFLAVNVMMGVSPISSRQFLLASFLGMLPGTFVYVHAGRQLANIKSFSDILSPSIILSFILLAGLPWMVKWALKAWQRVGSVAGHKKGE